MVTPCKTPPNSFEPKNPSNATSTSLLPPYPATSHTRRCPTGLYPLQLIPGGNRAHGPFRVSEGKKFYFFKIFFKNFFKGIKKDLRNYTEYPD
jgi:hypothetical protein